MTPLERFKQAVWRVLYPLFPLVQRPFSIFHGGRQPYHLGWLASGKTLEDLKVHLIKQGFGNHFVAWDDTGQVLSWRKFDGFDWQYHIRVFKDGEIRGHYERTPEAAPIEHFSEIGEEARRVDMLKFLGHFVTLKKHISHLQPDPDAKAPDSQITFS